MTLFNGLDEARHYFSNNTPVHLAIGIFDGVHIGHRALLKKLILHTRRLHHSSAVLTFWPHPAIVLGKGDITLITSREAKNKKIGDLGIDYIIEQPFDLDFAEITANGFCIRLHKAIPNLQSIFVGETFRFGKERQGTSETFEKCLPNVAVFTTPRLEFLGDMVSSSRIRMLIDKGRNAEARALLG